METSIFLSQDVRSKVAQEIDLLKPKACDYADAARKKWVSTFVGEGGYTYDELGGTIREPLKSEQSWSEYKRAYSEYMDKHTIRIPNDMISAEQQSEKKDGEKNSEDSVNQCFAEIIAKMNALKDYNNQLLMEIKRKLTYKNGTEYIFQQNYANSFQLCNKSLVVDITYYHLHRTSGGENLDGDTIDTSPYYINYSKKCGSCSVNTQHTQRRMTIDDVMINIRNFLTRDDIKRQKTDYSRDDFCKDIAISLLALEKKCEFDVNWTGIKSSMHI